MMHCNISLLTSTSLLFTLLSLCRFLLRALAFNRAKDSAHALIIGTILLNLLLLLNTCKETCILAKFTDGTPPLLLVLIAQLRSLVLLVVRILAPEVV